MADDGTNPQRIMFITDWKFRKTINGACQGGRYVPDSFAARKRFTKHFTKQVTSGREDSIVSRSHVDRV